MRLHELRDFIERMVRPLRNRIYLMISRAVLEAVDDTKKMQLVKLNILAGEDRDQIERFQNFGFTSNPPDGAECIVLALGGNREHLVVIACDDRRVRKINLQKGETAIQTDDGTFIHLKKNGHVEVVASTKVLVTCPEVEMSGNLTVKGDLTVEGSGDIGEDLAVGGNIDAGGDIAATGTLEGAGITSTGGGDVSGGGTTMSAIKSTFNGHTHTENPPATGGETNAPTQQLP